ncbi:aldo/keto reductase (plasmid) [Paroceanicella profunda]|uniref:Aldo/keto reductase n=1 Tax=Paroceanicella profunda TaxID=2579971 RepID=A0A5B8G0J1_9RHOB|nr:aldo/keto reductase [Paroceanicella profunda]QDL94235.1 aldo/keto reductase [Paroceanicella profunda]
MTLPDLLPDTRFRLAPGHEISRVIRGGWQLAGGHGAIDGARAVEDMIAFADAGITTFDCADIYTGVEELIGRFRTEYANRRGAEALARIRVHTKMVPDLSRLFSADRAYIAGLIERSLERLGMERLDLVQFHWWDYNAPGWLEIACWLAELRAEGKIRTLGVTNFDTDHLRAMCLAGVPVASAQVQYSVLDARPEKRLTALAAEHGFSLLCYGTVAGGFLSERWLGVAEPAEPLENRSLTKYKLIIEDIGGWELFQDILRVLKSVAQAHGTDIATVASAYMLDLPGVAAVIVGARNRAHLAGNLAVMSLRLSAAERAAIAAVLGRRRPLQGDVYSLERDRHGRHGSIMKYNLNDAPH